jgi:hypothetical protein
MEKSRKNHLFKLIGIVVVVFSLVTLACSATDKLFVDTEATNQAIQDTQDAQDARSTERALQKTQDAINAQATDVAQQATEVAQQATQNAVNLQSTQQAQHLTETAAAQQNQQQNQTGGGQNTFYVENNSSTTVCYLYMAPSSQTEWGDDWLGSDTLPTGTTFTISNLASNTYDLKAEDCSHNILATQLGVAVPPNDTWTLTDTGSSGSGSGSGSGYTLTIENYSSTTICYVYISPSSSTTWGDDWLGSSNTIPSNSSFYFTNVPANTYDLRADDCSNNVIAQYNSFTVPTYDTWQVYNP